MCTLRLGAFSYYIFFYSRRFFFCINISVCCLKVRLWQSFLATIFPLEINILLQLGADNPQKLEDIKGSYFITTTDFLWFSPVIVFSFCPFLLYLSKSLQFKQMYRHFTKTYRKLRGLSFQKSYIKLVKALFISLDVYLLARCLFH